MNAKTSNTSNFRLANRLRTIGTALASATIFLLADPGFGQAHRPRIQNLVLSVAVTNSGTISLPGQQDTFTFVGTVGQRLYFDTLDYGPQNITATLRSPNGTTIFSGQQNTDQGPFYLTEAGTNTLVLDGGGDATGSYSFRTLDMSSATPLTLGVTITNSLNPQSVTLVYSFLGTNGQHLMATNIAASSANAYWRLISPAGINLYGGSQSITYSPGEVVLSETGTYLLLFEGYTATIGALDFQSRISLVSNPSGSASGFGTVRSGSTVAGQTNDFVYTAPAGLWVYLDSQTNISPVNVYLLDPSNACVSCGLTGDADSGPFLLPRSGAYTLRIVGSDAGSYRLRLLDLSSSGSGATALTMGTTYTATLNPGFKTDVYRFTGAVGQRLLYDPLDENADPVHVVLFDPSGTTLYDNNWGYFSVNSEADFGVFTLAEPGTYYLAQQSQSQYPTNDYSFRLIDVAQAPAAALTLDTQITGTRNPDTKSDLYRFSGTAGQRLYFDAMATNDVNGSWNLVGPNNQGAGNNNLQGDFEVTLPQTGTYVLDVYGNLTNAGGYSIRVVTPNTVVSNLILGATVTGTLVKPGDEHRYIFSGSAGQRLVYDALDADHDAISEALLDPQGAVLYDNVWGYFSGNADTDFGVVTLPVSGTYTLLIKGSADYVSDYSFRLIDVAQAPTTTLTLDTQITGTRNPGTKSDLYRFSATAGQRLYFDAMATNDVNGSWNLVGPNNQGVGNNNLQGDFEVTLPQTGTYVLDVYGNLTNAGGYSIRVVTPNTVISNLTLGATVTGTLVKAGDEHRYTFSGSTGQRLFYDALDGDHDAVVASLYDPRGVLVYDYNLSYFNIDSDNDFGPFTLNSTGVYALVIKGSGDYVSDYSFRLLDVAAAPAITYGLVVTNQLNPQLQAQLYRITGTAGQHISITNVAASNGNANWYLFNTYNTAVLGAQPITAALGNYVLPVSGTYVVAVEGNFAGIGTLDYQFRISLLGSGTGATNGFGVVHCAPTTAGQIDTFGYTGPAGLPIYLDNQIYDPTVTYTLYDASSNVVFSAGGGSDAGPYSLLASTNYTLVAAGSANGQYCFRLLDLTSGTTSNLTLGAVCTAQLNSGFRTDVYRFAGTNGQRIYYDPQTPDYDVVSTRLVTPSRGADILNSSEGSESGPFMLAETGTYYLFVAGGQTNTATYRFRLLDANQAPATNVAYDTVVNGSLFNPFIVPPGSLSVTGTYVNVSLRSYTAQDDWRVSQAGNVTGTRVDAAINFASATYGGYQTNANTWGTLASVGFTAGPNGTDDDWDNYSVQWDGTITITNANTRLYLHSDDGSRMWIDVNNNGTFENTVTEFVDNNWGTAQALTLSRASVPLAVGTYRIRVQYEEGANANAIYLLADRGDNLGPLTTAIYRFNGTNGQRLFFDSLNANASSAYWTLYGPNNQSYGNNYLSSDFETTLTAAGAYLLVLKANDVTPYTVSLMPALPYSFRIVTPNTTTNAYTIGTTVAASLDEPGEEDWYSFTVTAGQRLYFDALAADYNPIYVTLYDPAGNSVFLNGWYADQDLGPATLTQSGTYLLRFKATGDYTNAYNFRLLDAGAAPVLALDTPVTNTLTTGFGAVLYQLPLVANLRLYFDDLGAADSCGAHKIYGPQNQDLLAGTYYLGTDMELTPAQTGTGVVVFASGCTNVPYMFQIIPGNHAPVLAAITNRTIIEQTTLSFTAAATDLEVPNDTLTWSLDAGAPANASINAASGLFSWTPTEAQGPATNTITIRVRDDGTPSFEDFRTFTIVVNESNQPPVLTLPANQTITELSAISLTATATDPDLPANSLTFALVSGPSNLTVSAAGAINWTPSEAQGPSTNIVTISVTDTNPLAVNATSLSVTSSFQIVVNESNSPPVLTLPANTNINEQVAYSANAAATDPDLPANPLTFALVSGPSNLTVSAAGLISWTPSEAQGPSTNIVTIKVSDTNPPAINATSLSVTQSYQIVVMEVNTAPVLTVPTNQIVIELVPLSLIATATDADLPTNTLTFALVSGPTNLTVATNGAINWTPSEAQGPSTNTVTIRVFDNGSSSLSTTQSFQITVNESNSPPTLTVPPNTNILTSAAYSTTATATDPDIPTNVLTFALVSPPAGMTINSTNGVISWTPTEGQGPSTNTILVSVTDTNPAAINAKQLSVTNSYTIIVTRLCSLTITAPPAGRAAVPGATVAFAVAATTSAGQTNYQWTLNNTNIIGATNKTLTVTNLQNSGFGPYRAVVSDGTCTVTSTPAMLTLAVSPSFHNLGVSGTTLTMYFNTENGPTYVVETKTNLTDVAWSVVTTYAGDGTTKPFTTPTQPKPRSFFRIRLQ